MSDTPLIRIVDDDPELLASQKMLLETLGWEVITYASGVEFLKHDELKRPGCVVLDMRMPGMTGLEVQEELENRESPTSRSSSSRRTAKWTPRCTRCGTARRTLSRSRRNRIRCSSVSRRR